VIVGQTLNTLGGMAYFSPTFPRGGLAALFSVEVEGITPNTTLGIAIEHRNEEDTTWTTAATFGAITAAGVHTKDATTLKELLRLNYTLTGTNTDGIVHMIVAAPAWRPY